MKKILTIILISTLVMFFGTSAVYADEISGEISVTTVTAGPAGFVDTLYTRMVNKLSDLLPTNKAETTKAIDQKAAAIQIALQNYNNKYIKDITKELSQYRISITNAKLQAMEDLMNDYVATMEEKKPEIINNFKQQLQQQADKDYQNAVNRLLQNLK